MHVLSVPYFSFTHQAIRDFLPRVLAEVRTITCWSSG